MFHSLHQVPRPATSSDPSLNESQIKILQECITEARTDQKSEWFFPLSNDMNVVHAAMWIKRNTFGLSAWGNNNTGELEITFARSNPASDLVHECLIKGSSSYTFLPQKKNINGSWDSDVFHPKGVIQYAKGSRVEIGIQENIDWTNLSGTITLTRLDD